MNSWTDFFYIFMSGGALLLSVMGLWFTAVMPGIEQWSKRFFRGYFAVLIACSIFGVSEIIIHYYPVHNIILYLVMFMECLLPSLPFVMLSFYLLHCCNESLRRSRFLHIILGLWVVYIAMIVVAMLGDGIVYVTADGQYFRSSWYPVVLVPLILIMLLNFIATIKRRNRLSRKTLKSFLGAILPVMVVLVIHMFIDIYPIIDICMIFFSLLLYSVAVSDQIEKNLMHERAIAKQQREIAEQQREIADQRLSIMVLEMRPHFIYNTLTSIYCLCRQDPEQARQVIMDFTAYLRKNFTAVASSSPIPFSQELEHTQAYLAVEQAQYEDSLFVEYDTPHIRFRVPPLTLQPIVENAIKHGRDPYAGPFHISIRTRKTDTGSEIIVTDDGRGYEPAGNDEPHIALKNIIQRLEMMCGGELAITRGDTGGTVVKVTIPNNI